MDLPVLAARLDSSSNPNHHHRTAPRIQADTPAEAASKTNPTVRKLFPALPVSTAVDKHVQGGKPAHLHQPIRPFAMDKPVQLPKHLAQADNTRHPPQTSPEKLRLVARPLKIDLMPDASDSVGPVSPAAKPTVRVPPKPTTASYHPKPPGRPDDAAYRAQE